MEPTNLKFADHILILSNNMEELEEMVIALNEQHKRGLRINISKTKILTNGEDARQIQVGGIY